MPVRGVFLGEFSGNFLGEFWVIHRRFWGNFFVLEFLGEFFQIFWEVLFPVLPVLQIKKAFLQILFPVLQLFFPPMNFG